MKYFIICVLVFFANSFSQNISGRVVNASQQGLENKKVEVHLTIDGVYTKFLDWTDALGNFLANSTTNVETESHLPDGYEISNNFPQPFNPKTIFYISLPKQSQITADVFTILGEKILTIDKIEYPAGNNKLIIELNGFANGVYITRINIDDKYFVTRKLLLLYGSQHARETSIANLNKIKSTIYLDSITVSGDAIKKKSILYGQQIVSGNYDIGNILVDSAFVLINGRVYKLMEWQEQNNGVEGANITIGNQTTATGPNGEYSLIIPSGKNSVIITHPNIWTRQTKIRAENDATIDWDILDKTNWNDTLMTFYDDVYGRARNPPANITRKWNVKGERQAIFYITADTTNEFEKTYANIIKNKINNVLKPLFITPKYPQGYHKDAIIEIGTNPEPWPTAQNYIVQRGDPGGTNKATTSTRTNYFDSTSQYQIGEVYAARTTFRMDLDAYWINRVALHELLTGMTDAIRSDLLPSVLNIFPSEENSNGTEVDRKCILYHTQRPGGSKSPDTDEGWEGWE